MTINRIRELASGLEDFDWHERCPTAVFPPMPIKVPAPGFPEPSRSGFPQPRAAPE